MGKIIPFKGYQPERQVSVFLHREFPYMWWDEKDLEELIYILEKATKSKKMKIAEAAIKDLKICEDILADKKRHRCCEVTDIALKYNFLDITDPWEYMMRNQNS